MWQIFLQNNFDREIALRFLAGRSDFGVGFFSAISFLGNWKFIIPTMLAIVIFLFIKKRKDLILSFVFSAAGAEAVVFFLKILFQRPRPFGAAVLEKDFSFPSGHADIAVVFYGYLAYMIIGSVKSKYKIPLILAALLVIGLIGFSRLYLGVHYLSDVLAGYLIGSLFLAIGIYLSKYFNNHKGHSLQS